MGHGLSHLSCSGQKKPEACFTSHAWATAGSQCPLTLTVFLHYNRSIEKGKLLFISQLQLFLMFLISNNRTSDKPHRLQHCHCTKLDCFLCKTLSHFFFFFFFYRQKGDSIQNIKVNIKTKIAIIFTTVTFIRVKQLFKWERKKCRTGLDFVHRELINFVGLLSFANWCNLHDRLSVQTA